jgi:hypothetical protein
MMRTLAEAHWAISIIEDTATGEVSFQCMCGQVGMYPQRIVLTDEEVDEFSKGRLDVDKLAKDVCKDAPRVARRFVPPIPPDMLC